MKVSGCNDNLQDVTDRVRCKVRSPLDRFLASLKEPLFESVVSIWVNLPRTGKMAKMWHFFYLLWSSAVTNQFDFFVNFSQLFCRDSAR